MKPLTSEAAADGVQRIAMARPEVMNAIDANMRDAFVKAMADASADPTVRAIVITGEGGHFSAGGDIAFLTGMNAVQLGAYHSDALELVRSIALCPKPTIASVRGACAGGALGFALSCDYLAASNTSKFSAQFLRIGLVPDMGVAYFLTHRLGEHRARRFLLDNRAVTAAEAMDIGLCDALYADEELEAETVQLAIRLAALPPSAVRQTKWLLRQAAGDLHQFLDDELRAAAPCLGSEEFVEGASAFLEKRPPRF